MKAFGDAVVFGEHPHAHDLLGPVSESRPELNQRRQARLVEPYLKRLGITALELMPVTEFPGRRNWWYDGVNLYAPHSAYGGPSGLEQLV